MSVSELVISGYLLGDVCEFFIKKIMVADYLFNCRIILNGEIDNNFFFQISDYWSLSCISISKSDESPSPSSHGKSQRWKYWC